MRIVRSVAEMKSLSRRWAAEGKTIGFVPTMGYLHEGHMSLVRESKKRSDVTVVSVFVNPAQFGPREDFRAYPRDPEKDRIMLEAGGVEALFIPDAAEIYPPGYRTYVEVHDLQDTLCGRTRPGHFRGVCTVVLKLFNIVGPDVAFFGWKDAQQVVILKKMVRDLDLDVRIEACPIVRDADGLALSSRNSYLSAEDRRAALSLSESLREAAALIEAGERDAAIVIQRMKAVIGREPLARVDYIEIVDGDELVPLKTIEGTALIALAVFIGGTRLIDNARITTSRTRICRELF
jgi:pantoate--beta-alanine ligase